MKSVLVIGNNCVDIVFTTSQPLAADSKIQASGLSLFAGGQGANAAADMAGLGLPTRYFGAFGHDAFGELSRRAFEERGVGLEGCFTVPDCPHHAAALVVDRAHGTRSIVMNKDARLRLDDCAADRASLEGVGLLYLDGHELSFSRRLAAIARARGIAVLADAEEASPAAAALLPHLTSLIAPREVILAMGASADLVTAARALFALGPSVVVATMGAEGAEGLTAWGEHHRVAAAACDVVDTTGAGDAFHAGYVAGALRGCSFAASLELATRVAAAKCENPGPTIDRARLAKLAAILPTPAPIARALV